MGNHRTDRSVKLELVALLGGRFDPVHNGHLAIAELAASQLLVERVLLVANGQPAYKAAQGSYPDRLTMLRKAVEATNNQKLSVAELEPTGQPRYSLDTVKQLLSENCYPILVVGKDAFSKLPSWHSWQELLQLASFAVLPRAGETYELPIELTEQLVYAEDLVQLASRPSVIEWPVTVPECSSSAIRAKIQAGDDSWQTQVPVVVKDYLLATDGYSNLKKL